MICNVIFAIHISLEMRRIDTGDYFQTVMSDNCGTYRQGAEEETLFDCVYGT